MKQKLEWMLDCQLKDDYIGKKSYSILSYESNDQCRKIMRRVSPTVFLASRWSNRLIAKKIREIKPLLDPWVPCNDVIS